MPPLKVRRTARALIVSDDFQVLLLSITLPWLEGPTWTMPGGGIEEDESAEACARREIREETGHDYRGDLVPAWLGTIEFEYKNQLHRVEEQYFIARVTAPFEPSMANMMDYEKNFSLELRWLDLADLASEAHFSPRHIPDMVKKIKGQRLPSTPEQLKGLMPDNYRPA